MAIVGCTVWFRLQSPGYRHFMTDLAESAADIEIEVPLRTERAATVRVVAASLAADAGFSIDEIDDLRLAISEVFSMLLDTSPDGRARISFTVAEAEVRATISTVGSDEAIEVDDLGASILRAVVDEFVVDGSSVRLVKTATEANASN